MDEIDVVTTTGDAALVELGRRPAPAPEAGQAVVSIEAFSVNRGEILLLEGGRTDGYGKDVAGCVVQAAADGTGPPRGSSVVAHLDGGGWARSVAVDASCLVRLPEGLAPTAAAALPLPGLTALRLVRIARSEGARRVLLTGASGGVGHLFAELAAADGIAVTAVTRSSERGARLRELGADHVVTSVDDAGDGFDVAFESVGGETTGHALTALRTGGLLVWLGQASRRPAALDFFAVANGPGDVRLRSFAYWSDAAHNVEDLVTLVGLAAAGRLHPEIGMKAPWTDTARVLAAVRDREVVGNAVLTVTGQVPA